MDNTISKVLGEIDGCKDSTRHEKIKESTWLLSNLMNLSPSEIALNPNKIIKEDVYKKYKELMDRREKLKEPLQYLIGKAFFMDFELKVNRDVLIPRPETEMLVEAINNKYQNQAITALDIGTGSGAIAIALKKSNPSWNIYASDVSQKALIVAKENASNIGMRDKILFREGDLLHPWIKERGKIDLVVANLPYVDSSKEYVSEETLKWEPNIAIESKRKNLLLDHAGSWEVDALLKQFFQYSFKAKALALELSEEVAFIIKALWEKHPKIEKIEQFPDLNKKNRFLFIEIKE